jgi:hypothetical protein
MLSIGKRHRLALSLGAAPSGAPAPQSLPQLHSSTFSPENLSGHKFNVEASLAWPLVPRVNRPLATQLFSLLGSCPKRHKPFPLHQS